MAAVASVVAGSQADNKLQILQQREAAMLAKMASLPHDITHLGLSGPPLLPEPSWAATVEEVPAINRMDGPSILRSADSVWQDGSVPEHDASVWDPYFVWSASTPQGPVLGTYVENALSPATAASADAVYQCPRSIGQLTITDITGSTVTFRSSSGVFGSFDLSTHAWTFV